MSILDLDKIFEDFIVTPEDLSFNFYSQEQKDKIYSEYHQHLQKHQASNSPPQPEPTTFTPLLVENPHPFNVEAKKIINKIPFTIIREDFSKKIQIKEEDQISNCSTAPGGLSIAGSPQTHKTNPKRPLDDAYWNEEDLQKPQQKTFKSNNGGFIRSDVMESPMPISLIGTPKTPVKKANLKGKMMKEKKVLELPGSVKSKVKKDLGDHLKNRFDQWSQWFNPDSCKYLHNVLEKEQARGVNLKDFKKFVDGKSHDEKSVKIYREIINKCVQGFLSKDGEKEFNLWMESSTKLTQEKREEIYRYRECEFGY